MYFLNSKDFTSAEGRKEGRQEGRKEGRKEGNLAVRCPRRRVTAPLIRELKAGIYNARGNRFTQAERG